MNVNNWIESILQSHIRYAIPIMTHPGIEMLGYTVKDAVQNGEIHSKSINNTPLKIYYMSHAAMAANSTSSLTSLSFNLLFGFMPDTQINRSSR